MRKRFIAIFLAGGLMLEVCGCGSKSVNADEYIAQMGPEEVPVHYSGSSTEPANESVDNEQKLGNYSANELVEMLSTGELLMEELETEVATGVIDYETYEEVLRLMSLPQYTEAAMEDIMPEERGVPEGDTMTATDEPSEKPETNVNPADYMATYVWEYENGDGYQLRETICLSPIFNDSEEDMTDMYAMWAALGGTVDEIPSKDVLYEISRPLSNFHSINHFNNMKYIIGMRTVDNLTDGFSITAANPYIVSNVITVDSTIDNPNEDGNAETCVTHSATTLLFYDDDRKCEVSTPVGVPLGGAKMTSDTWGPVRFLVVLPDDVTPNRPNGFSYDSLHYMIGTNPNLIQNKVTFTLHNWNE